jgi:hypothetical protein
VPAPAPRKAPDEHCGDVENCRRSRLRRWGGRRCKAERAKELRMPVARERAPPPQRLPIRSSTRGLPSTSSTSISPNVDATRPSSITDTESRTISALSRPFSRTRTPERRVFSLAAGSSSLPWTRPNRRSRSARGGRPGPPGTSSSRRKSRPGSFSCHRFLPFSRRPRSVTPTFASARSGVS